jgi:hypothetical protein
MSQPPSTESTESTESTDESTPDEEVPVACTLGQDDGQVRMRRWRALGAAADPRAQRSGHRLEMRYAPGPGIREELERLAAAERQCCSFVTWEVRLDGEHPTL